MPTQERFDFSEVRGTGVEFTFENVREFGDDRFANEKIMVRQSSLEEVSA